MSMSTDDLEDPFDLLREEGPEGKRLPVDTLVERRDLGPESYTLVAAGSFMLPHLAHLPSRPAQPEPTDSDADAASSKPSKPRASKPSAKPTAKPDAAPAPPPEEPEGSETRSW